MSSELLKQCSADFKAANYQIEQDFLKRFIAALAAKPFVILTGLSGSGKTKLASLFAQWLSPVTSTADPFKVGKQIGNIYQVSASDSIAVEFLSERGSKVLLPRHLIADWANFIEKNPETEELASKQLRYAFKDYYSAISGVKFDQQTLSWDTHLKPAALALIEARKSSNEIIACTEIVAVGADWTTNENIVGYPDGLDPTRYVKTKSLELIMRAEKNPDTPHFLILDEMNMSHVERYFSDFLSALESGDDLRLHGDSNDAPRSGVSARIRLPRNLYIVGTVNVDETTYMFSPKVLDRANVIEFRVSEPSFKRFLADPTGIEEQHVTAKGTTHIPAFKGLAKSGDTLTKSERDDFEKELLRFFQLFEAAGSEFGFRVAKEISLFLNAHKSLSETPWSFRDAFDAQVIQKLLPKLQGSRQELHPLLSALAQLCFFVPTDKGGIEEPDSILEKAMDCLNSQRPAFDPLERDSKGTVVHLIEDAYLPLSFAKVTKMIKALHSSGFTSFSE